MVKRFDKANGSAYSQIGNSDLQRRIEVRRLVWVVLSVVHSIPPSFLQSGRAKFYLCPSSVLQARVHKVSADYKEKGKRTIKSRNSCLWSSGRRLAYSLFIPVRMAERINIIAGNGKFLYTCQLQKILSAYCPRRASSLA
jgi:hypothetical protein